MTDNSHAPTEPERMYRCVAASVWGFVQQVAVSYIRTGHYFYVPGRIKPEHDPALVDAKIIDRYQINVSRWTRALRKHRGEANLQYIRFDRFFLIMATHGTGSFFDLEGMQVRDCRRVPIKFVGYSLSHRGGHPHVRLTLDEYNLFKAAMLDIACRLTRSELEAHLAVPRYAPYAPVKRQLWNIWRHVNRARSAAGLEQVSGECLPLRRRIVRPFGDAVSSTGRELEPPHGLAGSEPIPPQVLSAGLQGERHMNNDDDFRSMAGPEQYRSGLVYQPPDIPINHSKSVGIPGSLPKPAPLPGTLEGLCFPGLAGPTTAEPVRGDSSLGEPLAVKGDMPDGPTLTASSTEYVFPSEWEQPVGPASGTQGRDAAGPRSPETTPPPPRPRGIPR